MSRDTEWLSKPGHGGLRGFGKPSSGPCEQEDGDRVILPIRRLHFPHGSSLKPPLFPNTVVEPWKIIKAFCGKLLSLWDQPRALICIAGGLFLDPLESECV